jgi:hypothetical protein
MNELESHDMVPRLDICYALANTLNDTSTLVAEDYGKGAFRIFPGECICIGMTNSSVIYLDSNFVSTGRFHFDVFNCQVLAGFPRNRSLCII